jgi:uncharacterized damage-inducible protein DinB
MEEEAMRVVLAMTMVAGLAAPAAAQTGPVATALKGQFDMVKGNITKSAAKVSEDLYAFKPTPEVRSFGQVVAHIADANYMICGTASGTKGPEGSVEKTKTSKADLQKALADSFAFCDAAWAGLTDAKAAEAVNMFGMPQTRLTTLVFNTAHDFEHYGNLVTYMRLKSIVPPSSEGR